MNRLANEVSPYLRQHADNPVDWFPWGREALELARRENRPILLSIGYAACHWCHVMAHESFENPETARLMNEAFVNIKVDREERPDLDAIYMTAVQAMTGHGGWPMTMFLTPEGVPFSGGTYFPPDDRHGMPSFRRVLASVAAAYRDRPGDIAETAGQVRALYAEGESRAASLSGGTLSPALLSQAARGIARQYDVHRGGFGAAPKFPHAMALDFVLRAWRRGMLPEGVDFARRSFLAMARGGIYDQVGGGFHRYSVDDRWLVPHFEKMLYDNALLIRLGAHLWQATGDAEVRRTVEDTAAWVAEEMTSPDGGFYSSLDADSEGHEGRFYVWTMDELAAALGDDAPAMARYWGASRGGNFEGANILHVAEGAPEVDAATIRRARARLAAARHGRVRPGRDDKIITSWNGLMMRALADAARVFGDDTMRRLAVRNGTFVFEHLVRDGRAYRAWSEGAERRAGYLDDHAAPALGALALYELTFDGAWVARARALADGLVTWFADAGAGASFHDTAHDHEQLIARPRELTDTATPSGTALSAELLLRLGILLDDAPMRERAQQALGALAEPMERHPLAFGHLLGDADLAAHGAVEVALVGTDSADLARAVASCYVPGLVMAATSNGADGGIALLRNRAPMGGRATAYVCRNYTCDEPVTAPSALVAQLEAAVRGG